MLKTWSIIIAAFVVFGALTCWWLSIAAKTPLWIDEFYSQVSSIHGLSYGQILSGKVGEGNVTPLFYVMQKILQDVTGYHTPQAWINGQWGYNHPDLNLLLRIFPVMCMAAGIAVIFYYFALQFNIWLGLYSLGVSLSSFMVWSYAFEARPYALWFVLSAVQMVLVLKLFRQGKSVDNSWGLVIVHWLLALTSIFSIIQNVAACAVLALFGMRRLRFYVTALVIPVSISLFYYSQTPKYDFWFKEGFMGLLGASLPLDRIAVIALGFMVLCLSKVWPKPKWWNALTRDQWQKFAAALLFTALIFAGCWLLLMKLKAGELPNKQGFQVSNRYFMVLAPAGIIMTTLASYYIATLPKGILRKAGWGILAVLFIFRFLRTYALVIFKAIS